MGCRNACICSGRCSESCKEIKKYGNEKNIYQRKNNKQRKL